MSGRRALALCAAAWLATGCAAITRDVTAPLDPGDARREAQRLLDSPAVADAAEHVAQRFVAGLLGAFDDAGLERRLQALSRTLAESIARDLGPALRAALASDAMRAELALVADEVTRAAVRALAEGLERDLAPAMQAALARNVGPGLAAMLEPPLVQRVGLLSREAARAGVSGAEDAFGDSALAVRAERLLQRAGTLLLVLAIIAGVAGLALLALLPWQWTRLRRARGELARREQALMLLAHAIKATEGRPWAPELRETLRHELSDSEAAEYVREVLRRHPDLRMH